MTTLDARAPIAEAVLAPAPVPVPSPAVAGRRRRELGEFLRTRRARLSPEAIGLAPGVRRRTPGLRREEVAQEAGVGVTWYTWLEQGRPINASAQVLDAIARALRLDEAERAHLFRLADATPRGQREAVLEVPASVLEVVEALHPLPTMLVDERLDVLASNRAQRRLHASWHHRPCVGRNILTCLFTEPGVRAHYLNFDDAAPGIVAVLRSAFARHLGEPTWTEFIQRLERVSPLFAELWARHDVARPGPRVKHVRVPGVGDVRLLSTSLAVLELPATRLLVQTPADELSRQRLDRLLSEP
jgi:transcriptional regulator with XRE-family HTH domain